MGGDSVGDLVGSGGLWWKWRLLMGNLIELAEEVLSSGCWRL
jgi:hypothetical protein